VRLLPFFPCRLYTDSVCRSSVPDGHGASGGRELEISPASSACRNSRRSFRLQCPWVPEPAQSGHTTDQVSRLVPAQLVLDSLISRLSRYDYAVSGVVRRSHYQRRTEASQATRNCPSVIGLSHQADANAMQAVLITNLTHARHPPLHTPILINEVVLPDSSTDWHFRRISSRDSIHGTDTII
jgi:hypothetical protein